MESKELLNNIIAVTSARSVIQENKYTYEEVVKIAEEYAKQMCVEQRKMCNENYKTFVVKGGTYKGPLQIKDPASILEAPLATDKQ